MLEIQIKPLSVNDAFKGRRFKTDKYKAFESDMLFLLPKSTMPEGKLKVKIVWGFSSKGSDIDNPTKPFLDVLQKKYGINDNMVYDLHLVKEIVKKGREFIRFEISGII